MKSTYFEKERNRLGYVNMYIDHLRTMGDFQQEFVSKVPPYNPCLRFGFCQQSSVIDSNTKPF